MPSVIWLCSIVYLPDSLLCVQICHHCFWLDAEVCGRAHTRAFTYPVVPLVLKIVPLIAAGLSFVVNTPATAVIVSSDPAIAKFFTVALSTANV